MNLHRAVLALLATILLTPPAGGEASPPAPKFYAYCVEVGVPNVNPRPLAEQTKLLRDLGFDGVGYELWLDDALDASLKLIEDGGLQLYLVWTSVNVNPAQPAFDPRLPAALGKLKGRPVTVSVLLRASSPAIRRESPRPSRFCGNWGTSPPNPACASRSITTSATGPRVSRSSSRS